MSQQEVVSIRKKTSLRIPNTIAIERLVRASTATPDAYARTSDDGNLSPFSCGAGSVRGGGAQTPDLVDCVVKQDEFTNFFLSSRDKAFQAMYDCWAAVR